MAAKTEETGYPVSRFLNAKENLKQHMYCARTDCQGILRDARKLSTCGHSLCLACIEIIKARYSRRHCDSCITEAIFGKMDMESGYSTAHPTRTMSRTISVNFDAVEIFHKVNTEIGLLTVICPKDCGVKNICNKDWDEHVSACGGPCTAASTLPLGNLPTGPVERANSPVVEPQANQQHSAGRPVAEPPNTVPADRRPVAARRKPRENQSTATKEPADPIPRAARRKPKESRSTAAEEAIGTDPQASDLEVDIQSIDNDYSGSSSDTSPKIDAAEASNPLGPTDAPETGRSAQTLEVVGQADDISAHSKTVVQKPAQSKKKTVVVQDVVEGPEEALESLKKPDDLLGPVVLDYLASQLQEMTGSGQIQPRSISVAAYPKLSDTSDIDRLRAELIEMPSQAVDTEAAVALRRRIESLETMQASQGADVASHGTTLASQRADLVSHGTTLASHGTTLASHGADLSSQRTTLASQGEVLELHRLSLDRHDTLHAKTVKDVATTADVLDKVTLRVNRWGENGCHVNCPANQSLPNPELPVNAGLSANADLPSGTGLPENPCLPANRPANPSLPTAHNNSPIIVHPTIDADHVDAAQETLHDTAGVHDDGSDVEPEVERHD